MDKVPSLDLMQFVEQDILPQYSAFDKAHQLGHVANVINNSLAMALKVGADIDMCYAIAAYHDLGLSGPRAIHHLTGGRILAGDARLKKWFSTEQIRIMKEAVEDHRASASRSPRSIYGKIIAEADRELDPVTVVRRTILFGLDNYPEKTKEEHFQRLLQHLDEKYSNHGYIRLWISGSPNEEKLKELRTLIENPKLLGDMFNRLWDETN